MPRDKPFLFLRNDVSVKEKFNKQRAFQPPDSDDDDEEPPKLPKSFHQQRLNASSRLLNYQRAEREKKRSIQVPAIIDVVRIHFLTRINQQLQKKFAGDYGLDLLSLEDFNKTGLFKIRDEGLFHQFKAHVTSFCESTEESYEGKPWAVIVLIRDFLFLTADRRRISFNPSMAVLNLLPLTDRRSSQLLKSLQDYLDAQGKTFRINNHVSSLEVDNINAEELTLLLDNFDNIKAVTSSRAGRVRPGTFGDIVREYGFKVLPDPNNVTVAIIDTGVEMIAPLQAVNSRISLDITGTAPYFDENGHGTMVAGLVALGSDFLENIQEEYASHANIAVFKVLQQGNDDLQVSRIVDGIRKLREQGIRLFNLSLNEYMFKEYNSGFSDFAFQLDKLAYQLDILIFISTGNLTPEHAQALVDQKHEAHRYPFHFYKPGQGSDIHKCELTNICPPAESLNNITVGAIADNYRNNFDVGITPAKEYPAFYTRKFHYDYEQEVNGTRFTKVQRNKFLNKPDVIFNGGDFLEPEAGLEVLTSPLSQTDKYFSQSAGTSLATPLVTSLGAQIAKVYPSLNCQTIKAILLNASEIRCGDNPPMFRHDSLKNVLKRLTGNGSPNADYILFTNENEITYVIEDEIKLEEIKSIQLRLPAYLVESRNKLCFTGTLCYKFDPLADNHLNYCPLQIVYGFFRDVPVEQLADGKAQDYKINNGPTWSEDFWPVESRLYSNVQYQYFFLDADKIASVDNTVTLGIKCTGKKEIDPQYRAAMEKRLHPFSLVLRISEVPESRATGELYNEIIGLNRTEAIPTIDLDTYLDAEVKEE